MLLVSDHHEHGKFAGRGRVVHHLAAVAIFDKRGEVGPAEFAACLGGEGDTAGKSGESFAQLRMPIGGKSLALWISYEIL